MRTQGWEVTVEEGGYKDYGGLSWQSPTRARAALQLFFLSHKLPLSLPPITSSQHPALPAHRAAPGKFFSPSLLSYGLSSMRAHANTTMMRSQHPFKSLGRAVLGQPSKQKHATPSLARTSVLASSYAADGCAFVGGACEVVSGA